MNKVEYTKYKETVYCNTINGLKVVYVKNESLKRMSANLTVNYGAANLNFNYKGKDYLSPAGTAHFIEHKIFELSDGTDAFLKLSNLGASANAYTSNSATTYIFSTTSNFYEAFNVFLEYIFTDTFNSKTVEVEKGIILEELAMYENKPMYKMQNQLLKNVYKNFPIRETILGTKESINATTEDTLRDAYKAFYHPNNMVLYVSGNLDLEECNEFLNNKIGKLKFEEFKTKTIYHEEPKSVVKQFDICDINSQTKNVAFGFKFNPKKENIIEYYYKLSMLCDIVLGEYNEEINKLQENQIIYDNFNFFIEADKEYCYLELFTSTNDEEEAIKALKNIMFNFEKYINVEQIERLKKVNYSRFIYSLDNKDGLGENIISSMMVGHDYFNTPQDNNKITLNDLLSLKEDFTQENLSILVGKKTSK